MEVRNKLGSRYLIIKEEATLVGRNYLESKKKFIMHQQHQLASFLQMGSKFKLI